MNIKELNQHGYAKAYPCYSCTLKELVEATGEDEFSLIKSLVDGRECHEFEKFGCMKPIVPKCLAMVNIKSANGKAEAARVLLDENHFADIPKDVLYNGKAMRADENRFRDFRKCIEDSGRDFMFGEFIGKGINWQYNCYVLPDKDFGEGLPIMIIYGNPKQNVGLWYIGSDNGRLMFMSSAVNVPSLQRKLLRQSR